MRAVSTARCSATTLTFDALYEVALALNTDRATDVIYTDGDYVSPGGEAMTHLFKPDWSPSLFRGVMYVRRLLVVRRTLALDVGGFDSAFDAVQDFEFMLRISERTRKIRHVPLALYRRRLISESVVHVDKGNQGRRGPSRRGGPGPSETPRARWLGQT